MNTKHTRVVVALFLAVATLATMGFRTTNDHGPSTITADHTTCELVPADLSAIELLDYVDNACDHDLINRVEFEISWSTGEHLSTAALLDSTLGGRSFKRSGMTEYLEIIEADENSIGGVPASLARNKLWSHEYLDYHNPSSPWADFAQIGGAPTSLARNKLWSHGYLDYHNPSSPWADAK